MIKKISVLFLLIVLHYGAFAKKITEQQAILAGKNFYFERLNQYKPVDYKDITIEKVIEKNVEGQTLYYIVAFTNKGFVVVSGDDAVCPILCYVFDSRYDELNQPPAFIKWMQDYEKQIVYILKNNIMPAFATTLEWNRLLTAAPEELKQHKDLKTVSPLIKTTWDQGKYYNNFCPLSSTGPDGHTWAGCVPTAVGQIMNYYRHPLHGTGSYTYNDTIAPGLYDSLSADFGNTTYQWDLMPLEVTERQNDSAVAKLLYHFGVSVDLNYSPDGSGMYNHKAAYSLRTYFHYSPDCQYVFRDTATHTNWKQLILSHLDEKKPLYYAGWADTINVSGHAFVCDGYQDTSYFHFNWGWGGSYDGYFLLDNLRPGGSDFTLDHELIINFYPDSTSAYPNPCSGVTTFTKTNGTFSDGSGPLHTYGNNSDCIWIIQPADSVSNIKLNFLEFSTEQDSDVVIVYNGNNTSAPVLGTYSGSSLPAQITTTGKALCIHFISNDSISSGGFLASYTTTTPIFCSGMKDLTASSGTFNDGSGTFNYHPNQLCRWRVIPTGAQAVTLHFNSFDLTPGDYVKVTDIVTNEVLAEVSGSLIPEDIICNSGQMLVMFRSNDAALAQGFSASYYNSTGIHEMDDPEITVAPNPANDHVLIGFSNAKQEIYKIGIYAVEGKQIAENNYELLPGQNSINLDVSMLKTGFYIIRISSDSGIAVKKIIIE